jgi:hypothetical protein
MIRYTGRPGVNRYDGPCAWMTTTDML